MEKTTNNRHWNNGDRSSPVATVASGGVLWPVKPGQYKGWCFGTKGLSLDGK
ncbi:MAG: hypothetical protein KGZ97_04260 [Bacteroidetes bacterium]|nr:hypothetical protein [Bacteroidota bacterium]